MFELRVAVASRRAAVAAARRAWLLPRAPGWIATALHLPHTGLMLEQQADVSPVPRVRSALAWLGWALLVFAAARPQWLGPPEDVPRSGRDLHARDRHIRQHEHRGHAARRQPAPRFAAIQAIANDFIKRRAGDRVGLDPVRHARVSARAADVRSQDRRQAARRFDDRPRRPRDRDRRRARPCGQAPAKTARRISACWCC